MIWSSEAPQQKQVYVVFRKHFELPSGIRSASLSLFADSRYLLWINGKYVQRGPCRFNPARPEYDIINPVNYLHRGMNSIAILVHHAFNMGSARIMNHDGGLTALLEIGLAGGKKLIITTDTSWLSSACTQWLPSRESYSSITDNIDARLNRDDCTGSEFDDHDWKKVVPDPSAWGRFFVRGLPALLQEEVKPLIVLQPVPAAGDTLSQVLPLRISNGGHFRIDFGQPVQAFFRLVFEATGGAVLDVHCPLDPVVEGKHNKYIARPGKQEWISGDTFGSKYLDLVVTGGDINIYRLSVVKCQYPNSREGEFHSEDTVLNGIWNICVNTIMACSEDAYVDCIDRERAEWMADGYIINYPVSRVTIATREVGQKYTFSDTRLLRNLLLHMAMTQLPDGRLQPMPPSDYRPELVHGVIDDYSCLWVQALREYYDRGGDQDFVKEMWPKVVKAIGYFLNRRGPDGLINAMEFVYFNNPAIYRVCEGATINAFIFGSLKDAAYLGGIAGDPVHALRFSAAAKDLRLAYHKQLWDPGAGSYLALSKRGFLDRGMVNEQWARHGSWGEDTSSSLHWDSTGCSAHAALAALYYGLVPENQKSRVLDFLVRHFETENPFPYTYSFFLRVLFQEDKPESDLLALHSIRTKWAHETNYPVKGTSEAFHDGSPVHEAGAFPAYLLSSYVLGVRTEGLRNNLKLIIEPRLAGLKQISGIVLCEFGKVSVSWSTDETGDSLHFSISVPEGATAFIRIPKQGLRDNLEFCSLQAVVNGRIQYKSISRHGRYYQIKAGQGEYQGCISR